MRRHERWVRSPFSEDTANCTRYRSERHTCKAFHDLCEHHVSTSSLQKVKKAITRECARCGCSSPFDRYGDRICWCDSCQKGCQPVACKETVQAKPALTSESFSSWKRLISGLFNPPSSAPTRKQRQGRTLCASTTEVLHWVRLHPTNALRPAPDQQRQWLLSQAPAHQLTLSFQHVQMEALNRSRWERQMRSRWSRLSLSLCALQCRNIRRDALRKKSAARAAPPLPPPAADLNRLPSEGFARTTEDEAVLAEQLGLDLATYQMLRQLEQRDILPEDYDLLGRLDESLKPKTLDPDDLARFETRTYTAPLRPVAQHTNATSADFGHNFWQLPLEALPPSPGIATADAGCYGSTFWKLPMRCLEDDGTSSTSTCVSDGPSSPGNGESIFNVCGVCLVDLEGGEEIRILPCGHLFHRECIDHWLLNCSIACPVDKRDVI